MGERNKKRWQLLGIAITLITLAVLSIASASYSDAATNNEGVLNVTNDPAYKNTNLSFEDRARDLVSKMTLEEKVANMINGSGEVERLGIPSYDWWNECLHGVARAGVATVFPQAIGMAATWDTDLIHNVATVISDEARAKHHEFLRQGDRGGYKGLTFWTPNINIFRDPRWGRGHETYGEDPYLTSRIGVAFVKGLQGDDPKYLKVVATPKHYAVHSGPENARHHFDAKVSKKDLRETYLPAFKACIQEGGAMSVMGAYNRMNGEPCCASKTLLEDILRDEWGFDGYVVSDCGAINDIHQNHKVTTCSAESAAIGVTNGCDLECGGTYVNLLTAVQRKLISQEAIDKAVTRLFTARFRLGMFDAPEMVKYAQIPYSVNDSEEHRKLALQTARETMVLLKNDGILPLKKDLKNIAVIGPDADVLNVLLGNYFGDPSRYVTPLKGIEKAVSPDTKVTYVKGCDLTDKSKDGFPEAVSSAEKADVVVMCLGLSPAIEGEEGDAYNSDASGDRIHIDLPGVQQELLEAVHATGKPVVVVMLNGSAVSINWPSEHVSAILEAWYPGEEGGTAVADILFGDYNPGGRLPVTFVKSLEDLPPFEDYSMKGRTYRYFEGTALYPFGFGLSYTKFAYTDLKLSSSEVKAGDKLDISVSVNNTGDRAGDEVVQLYLTDVKASVTVPIRQLAGVQRISLKPGEAKKVSFTLTPEQMSVVDNDGKFVLEPGEFKITVGGSQGDARSIALGATPALTTGFSVKGM